MKVYKIVRILPITHNLLLNIGLIPHYLPGVYMVLTLPDRCRVLHHKFALFLSPVILCSEFFSGIAWICVSWHILYCSSICSNRFFKSCEASIRFISLGVGYNFQASLQALVFFAQCLNSSHSIHEVIRTHPGGPPPHILPVPGTPQGPEALPDYRPAS